MPCVRGMCPLRSSFNQGLMQIGIWGGTCNVVWLFALFSQWIHTVKLFLPHLYVDQRLLVICSHLSAQGYMELSFIEVMCSSFLCVIPTHSRSWTDFCSRTRDLLIGSTSRSIGLGLSWYWAHPLGFWPGKTPFTHCIINTIKKLNFVNSSTYINKMSEKNIWEVI